MGNENAYGALEGESFMDLIAKSGKEEGGQHVHGWENKSIVKRLMLLLLQ
jgi:hypothetical protein